MISYKVAEMTSIKMAEETLNYHVTFAVLTSAAWVVSR